MTTALGPTSAAEPTTAADEPATPTIWGLSPRQIHDRLWAALGIQVVRRHERSEIVAGAELFLLCDEGTLILFRPAQVLDTLYWLAPELMILRIKDTRPRGYREEAVTEGDVLVRFERVYRDSGLRSPRVALTPDRGIARLWQNAPEGRAPWRWLRSQIAPERRIARSASAHMYDESDPAQVMECVHEVMRKWERPDATIRRAVRPRPEVWADRSSVIDPETRIVGPVWVGAGRAIESGSPIVGPAVLWDAPGARAEPDTVAWLDIEPASLRDPELAPVRTSRVPGKRAFDIAFALLALAVTLPLYPIVALAIWLDDGRPIFFAHRRQTRGGREFPCLKFRSMKKQADVGKEDLAEENQADGPQFFIAEDPRITRVGRIIRKLQIDELPQFVNVLLGHMSVVGPRPSPHAENQYCPAWREARLSVRPGVTGLWQVSRTREAGLDFQEWIRFDLEYVAGATWWMDLRIIWRTVAHIINGLR